MDDPQMSWAVIFWSSGLALLAAFNIGLWARAAHRLGEVAPTLPPELRLSRRLQCWLAGGYVLGCAFRSVVPVFDVPRAALVDSVLASVLVGRTIATVAELCFAAQWALMLRETSAYTGSATGRWTARVILPLIAVAELCSWYSVLTTSNFGHVFEESLWAISAALMVLSLLVAWKRWQRPHLPTVVLLSAAGLAYFAYMLLVDVPLYASRWMADELAGRTYLTLSEGLRDIARPHVVSYVWELWRSELDWMVMYFGFGVWISIALIHSPMPLREPASTFRFGWLKPVPRMRARALAWMAPRERDRQR